ncbi:hypothetical protein F5Y13DRAFT_189569 [Hypoxylon sp. FL1857]|nr:hypothetical protein F5Y13DRAFT_189569 [Hypoxylon sp. FL1857]
MPREKSKKNERSTRKDRGSSMNPERLHRAIPSTSGTSSRGSTSRSRHQYATRATSSRMLTQGPEFWISDDKTMHVGETQEFSIKVKRSSDPAPRDYARIWLYQRVVGLTKFAPAPPMKLYGTVIQHWNSSRSVKFHDLALLDDGVFRVRVDIMQYNGGADRDIVVQTLFSQDIHLELPQFDTYIPEGEEDDEPSRAK